MSVLWAIGGFFIVLTPIVLVHELGHFVAARLSNIRVEEFGFGLPPRALKIAEKKGTIYSLNWIPLGGFVRPAGEDDPNVEGGLAGASKRARFFVLVAGAGANMIMAFVIFWIVAILGSPAVAIAEVNPGSPAEAAGLMSGDVVLAVNGVKADSSRAIADPMYANGGQPVQMSVLRDGQEISLTVVPRETGEYDPATEGPIGVALAMATGGERIKRGPIEAAVSAETSIMDYVRLFVSVPGMLIRGELSPREARPLSIVGISQIAGQSVEATASTRDLFPVLNMIAFINVALGLTNLLPIPALDGGRILFVLIEAVRGRRIEPEREGMVHIIGMLVLLGLMVLLVVQDIVNPLIPF
ncbi:MAG: M50 family metallopeptidase [Anaerolineae bacterium]